MKLRNAAFCAGLVAIASGCGVQPTDQALESSRHEGVMMQGVMMQGVMMQGVMMQGVMMQGTEIGALNFLFHTFEKDGAPIENVVIHQGVLMVTEEVTSYKTKSRTYMALRDFDFDGATVIGEVHDQVGNLVGFIKVAIKSFDWTDEEGVTHTQPAVEHDGYYPLPSGYPFIEGRTNLYGLLLVDAVELDPKRGGIDEAFEKIRVGSGEKYTPEIVCGVGPVGRRGAIPLQSLWDATGARHDDSKRFTFACTAGVASKCYRWGYRPWLGTPDAMGNDFNDLHQSCTRMARADYCGEGISWTVEGTTIVSWDNEPRQIQTWTSLSGWMFEGGWTPDGAVCLSKERWKKLTVYNPFTDTIEEFDDTRCPNQLLSPRLWDLGYRKSVKDGEEQRKTPYGPDVCDSAGEAYSLYDADTTNDSALNDYEKYLEETAAAQSAE